MPYPHGYGHYGKKGKFKGYGKKFKGPKHGYYHGGHKHKGHKKFGKFFK